MSKEQRERERERIVLSEGEIDYLFYRLNTLKINVKAIRKFVKSFYSVSFYVLLIFYVIKNEETRGRRGRS